MFLQNDRYHFACMTFVMLWFWRGRYFRKNFKMNTLQALKDKSNRTMESKEGLNALFEYATEGILITDERGEIVKINPSAERLFGYEQGELNGKKIEILIPKRLAKAHEEHRHDYHERPRPRSMGAGLQLYGRRKDNTELPVEVSLSPYSSPSGKFVIAFIVDVTERKKSEEKLKTHSQELEKEVHNRTMVLRETINELEKTKEELHATLQKERELGEMKSRFVSMASHEFRTPLATILSSLSLVNKYIENDDVEKRMKHIARIKSSISNMTEILNDFLSIGRLEEGQVQFLPSEFNLVETLEEIRQEMQLTIKTEQTIVYNHKGGSHTVFLDKKLLKHILVNLLSNAIKFSGGGQSIELSSQINHETITITIKDHGIGIPKEDQKHLFDRFFRANNVSTIQGTGLGLHIVKKYTDLMNGTVHVESQINKGTAVTIQLKA